MADGAGLGHDDSTGLRIHLQREDHIAAAVTANHLAGGARGTQHDLGVGTGGIQPRRSAAADLEGERIAIGCLPPLALTAPARMQLGTIGTKRHHKRRAIECVAVGVRIGPLGVVFRALRAGVGRLIHATVRSHERRDTFGAGLDHRDVILHGHADLGRERTALACDAIDGHRGQRQEVFTATRGMLQRANHRECVAAAGGNDQQDRRRCGIALWNGFPLRIEVNGHANRRDRHW
jgi:hypothetical protein